MARRKIRVCRGISLRVNQANIPMSKTTVALLGAGFIADIHLESYHRFVPDAEVVAVFTRKPERAEAFARKHGIAQWFGDLDKAITESDCDVGDIRLPNSLHYRAVL